MRRSAAPAARHLAAGRPTCARRSSRFIRVLLSLGLIGGLGAVNTMAYWSDAETVTAGTFSAGRLDLKLNGANSIDLSSTFKLADMVPGVSVAVLFEVQNPAPSNVAFTYTATGLASGALAPYLRFDVKLGSTAATNSAGRPQTGSCTGGTASSTSALWSTSTTVVPASPVQQLAVTGTQKVCVIAKLEGTTPNNMQGTSGSAVMTFTAAQLVAP